MIELSAVIITYNEAKNIQRCINSVKPVADEIIVVDSFSTDNTEKICRELGVTFITNTFQGHIEQKNFAVEKASSNFVLSLDADEELGNNLISKILHIKGNWVGDAYSVNRLTSYCGKWIKTCGWYPDKKIRMWDKRKGSWGGENPHDKVIMQKDAIITDLHEDLLHYSFPTIASHVKTANNFSEIASLQAYKKGIKVNFVWHILLNPTFTFFNKYFVKRGFMDGHYGFTISMISAFSNFLKYTKLRALYRDKPQENTN